MYHGKFNVRVFDKLYAAFNILSRFIVVKVESSAETLFIHLDEIASAECVTYPNIESNGFLAPATVRDLLIRYKAVDLILKRRRGKDLRTDKCFTASYDDVKEEGARYSKEFASFKKMCMERSSTIFRSLDYYFGRISWRSPELLR